MSFSTSPPESWWSGMAEATTDGRAVKYLRQALLELKEARTQVAELERSATEPIAIVGCGCRYPGGARSAEQLWELVAAGREAISGLPTDRGWDLGALDVSSGGSPYRGGFIEEATAFDADFFGIGEREAMLMDPQQRLLLETSWEACEDAGIDPPTISGEVGVYFGVAGAQTYAGWLLGAEPEVPDGYWSLGTAGGMMSGRVAHALDLNGPAVTIDAACASSAVALHLACQALRAGECSLALAGGAAVMSVPWLYVLFSRQSLVGMAPDGRCKSFADAADGAGFGEGVGVLLLERLADAEMEGHDVLALIRSSAVAHDGRSNGVAAPNGLAHQRVMRRAIAAAGVDPAGVDAVEGHGMGTPLGDALELDALLATYGQVRDAGPLALGSIKSNIGHSQAASGVGGVIKMAMALRHEELPRTLHADTPSRLIDWSGEEISLLQQSHPWPPGTEPRRAGVHSFGISGTSVHLILEEAPRKGSASPSPVVVRRVPGAFPWLLSAGDADGLRRRAGAMVEFALAHPELELEQISRSLATARPALTHRAAVFAPTREHLLEALRHLAAGTDHACVVSGLAARRHSGPVFAFAGGGDDWRSRLDESLSAEVHEFRAELRDVESTAGDLAIESDRLGSFAGLIALVAVWRRCGVRPAVVMADAHREAVIAAACAMGEIDLEQALKHLGLQTRDDSSVLSPSAAVVNDLIDRGHKTFVAVGPGPILPARLLDEAIAVPAAGPNGDVVGLLSSLARVWVTGVAVDWRAAVGVTSRIGLPTYPFHRRRHWVEKSPIWEAGGAMFSSGAA
jgi:acyl transferase domain-containing protein